MSVYHSRHDVLGAAAQAHPQFATAIGHGDTPLLQLACLLGEGLDTVDVLGASRYIDFLAYLVERKAAGATDPRERMEALRLVIGEEEGFTGNREEYDDPANSMMYRVLERRTGLPISLAVVYLATAQRLGWPLVGIDYPRHFLLRYRGAPDLLIMDPFNRGALIDFPRCIQIARLTFANMTEERLKMVARVRLEAEASTQRIVARMLKNLEASFLRRKEFQAAKDVIEKLLLLQPTALDELRDLGGVFHLLGDHRRALDCLRNYLAQSPAAPDRAHVQAVVARLRELLEED